MTVSELTQNALLGQVWTPADIALEMARDLLSLCDRPQLVLDPASGPATFSNALYEAGLREVDLWCYEVDERFSRIAKMKNKGLGFGGRVIARDYLSDFNTTAKFDAVIMNPPYIRQETIPLEKKTLYLRHLEKHFGQKFDRRANLFAFFLLKGVVDLKPGGAMSAIVYDAVKHTIYGRQVLTALRRHAELVSSKQVKTPFDGVLVDAQVLLFKKPPVTTETKFEIEENDGLAAIGELLDTRRGTSLPQRKIFIAGAGDPFYGFSTPFFVKHASLDSLVIEPDKRAYLAGKPFSGKRDAMFDWLRQRAEQEGLGDIRLVNNGVKGPILFNYYLRANPRHLWNPDETAVSDNFYASYSKAGFPHEAAWLLLNSDRYLSAIKKAGRNQGNGLVKLQLFEYKNARVPDWRRFTPKQVVRLVEVARKLIQARAGYQAVKDAANKQLRDVDV